jgi:hypothetical protein
MFLIIIFIVPLYWIIYGDNPQDYSLIEDRYLASFKNLKNDLSVNLLQSGSKDPTAVKSFFSNRIFNQTFQKDVESALSDQFPFRIETIKLLKAFDRRIIDLAYAFLPDPAIPTDMQSGLYVMRDKSLLIYGPRDFDETQKQLIDERIKNYETLINKYPDIHFLAFYFERLGWSPYHPLDKYFPQADNGRAFQYFLKNKPDKLILSTLGIIKAYYDIYELLAQNYPGISPPIKINGYKTFPDIGFLGWFAQESVYPITPDKLEVALYALPPYKIIKNGEVITYTHAAEYMAGKYSNLPYEYQYEEYYGKNERLLEYVFDNSPDRNLLIIGSSYKNPLQPMLASHYHHTYTVDLLEYPDFSLSNFLSEYQVDDILILGNYEVCCRKEWTINP